MLESWHGYQAWKLELVKTLSHLAAGIPNKWLGLAIKVELIIVKSAPQKSLHFEPMLEIKRWTRSRLGREADWDEKQTGTRRRLVKLTAQIRKTASRRFIANHVTKWHRVISQRLDVLIKQT